ncbi:hypothetical protein [Microbacterium atlanticum]|uniref:hypothetical protein n=1 Tax=Microbacterium atlanticum TaxID=2782168 RepID=UPI0018893B23|nr:hypothetical protein [Microbacterium atlanticum]
MSLGDLIDPGGRDTAHVYLDVRFGKNLDQRPFEYQLLNDDEGFLEFDETPVPDDNDPDIRLTGPVVFDTWAENAEGALYVVLYPVPADRLSEFDSWFAQEHTPVLLGARGWLRTRLFAPEDGPVTRVAVHYIANPLAMESDERTLSVRTPRADDVLDAAWTGEVREFLALSGK